MWWQKAECLTRIWRVFPQCWQCKRSHPEGLPREQETVCFLKWVRASSRCCCKWRDGEFLMAFQMSKLCPHVSSYYISTLVQSLHKFRKGFHVHWKSFSLTTNLLAKIFIQCFVFWLRCILNYASQFIVSETIYRMYRYRIILLLILFYMIMEQISWYLFKGHFQLKKSCF